MPQIPEQTLQTLTRQVETMVAESGNPGGFDAREWLQDWLKQPCPALGNSLPLKFLDTVERQTIVSGLLAQMQSGTFA